MSTKQNIFHDTDVTPYISVFNSYMFYDKKAICDKFDYLVLSIATFRKRSHSRDPNIFVC